jgi:prepilin-type N-terminal cleavage/methylation domain-containing protein
LLAERFREESGYSLVEVMVAIMILAIAIIPMVSMFDMGLQTATTASNYDKARALAKKQMENAQSLPYGTVKTNFPSAAPCTFDGSGLCESSNLQDPEFPNFRYTIRKQFVQLNASGTLVNTGEDKGMMRITVVVGWGGTTFNENSYTATGLEAR